MDCSDQGKSLKPGDMLENLSVTDLTVDGLAVARHGKQVVFLDRGLPGAVLCGTVSKVVKRVAYADVTRQVAPSPHDVAPWCPHVEECGACLWQNFSAEAALEWKRNYVRQTLARIGKLTDIPVMPVLASPLHKAFRNKMSYAFGTGSDGGTLLGLRRRKEHSLVEVGECGLQHPIGGEILRHVRDELGQLGLGAWTSETGQGGRADGKERGYLRFLVIRTPHMRLPDDSLQVIVECITGPGHSGSAGAQLTNQQAVKRLGDGLVRRFGCSFVHSERKNPADVAQGEKIKYANGADTYQECFGNLALSVPNTVFLQTNTAVAALLYQLADSEAQFSADDVLWDVYCGIGGAGLYSAGKVRALHGFEIQGEAVNAAAENAGRLGYSHCAYHAGDAGRLVSESGKRHIPQPDVILVDPPRAGLSCELREYLLHSPARRLLYISCNVATQARDAAILSSRWRAVKSLPVDMFPYTPHVENLLVFDRY